MFAYACGRGRLCASKSFLAELLSVVLHKDIARFIDVRSLDFDALITQTVPRDLPSFFDSLRRLIRLAQVVEEFGQIAKELSITDIILEVLASMCVDL